MQKNVILTTFLLLSACVAYGQISINAPLSYQPDSGAYTMRLWVGCPPQPMDAVVDTGSANLNLLGNKKLCPHCLSDLNKPTRYTPSRCAIPFQDYFEVAYGTGMGKVQVYQDEVRLAQTDAPFKLNFSVYTRGQHINNVVGLAYDTIAAPREYPLLPFFPAIQAHYKLESVISLKLCDQRSESEIAFGDSLVPQTQSGWQYTPIVKKDFYIVLLDSIVDKNTQKPLINFGPQQMDQQAILDSGTMGIIVLPVEEANVIKTYLKTYYGKQAQQALPDIFWTQNECIETDGIDTQAFPPLQIKLMQWDAPNKTITLDLPPERYINSGGCGKGYVRLAFMGQDIHQQKPEHFKDHSKITPLTRSTKILGTPIFENYVVTIHRGDVFNTTSHYESRVGFYPNTNLCETDKQS